ncbi:hypothetical protein LTR94_004376 [Friedmanniomyces endolithicus]|nr:hypothetical protein LTR94_004376 [Friedmanniomyces endolithicus]
MAARADAITYGRFITSSEPVGETPLDATLWRLAVNWVVAMEPDRSSTEATALDAGIGDTGLKRTSPDAELAAIPATKLGEQ